MTNKTDLIPEADLSVTTHRLTPPGGQQVGKPMSGVRMEHLPSGITVIVDCERSQHKNRLVAEDAILGALTSPYYTGKS